MDIKDIREKIDGIDDELLSLFLKRMNLSEEVAKYKIEAGVPITNSSREREILTKVVEKSGDMESYSYHLFNTLFHLSKARQCELIKKESRVAEKVRQALENGEDVFPRTGSVACQGVEGSNSHAACEKLLPHGSIMYFKTFESVFDAVSSGLCKYGVLPIENSSNGSVRSVYNLLKDRDFMIVRSTRLCIRHHLLVKPGTKLEDIREIHSHEQAIGQCSEFLSKLGDKVTVVPCGNTALAAKTVKESEGNHIAAISSARCAEIYGLESLSEGIQNNDNNYTRFICITKKPTIYAGANKICFVVGCENKPGALYEVLSRLAILGVNMSKLESCPVQGRDFEFTFILEIDASVREKGVMSMLEELELTGDSFKFLGNYSEV